MCTGLNLLKAILLFLSSKGEKLFPSFPLFDNVNISCKCRVLLARETTTQQLRHIHITNTINDKSENE